MTAAKLVTPDEARALVEGSTSGPWRWFGDTRGRQIYLATVDRGRQFVMSFHRWGMQGATPAFRGEDYSGMRDAADYARYEVAADATSADDPRLYRHDLQGLRHPDATLIEAAPRLAATVIAQGDELEDLRAFKARHEALFAGGPDTPCRTTWHTTELGATECVEVPIEDLRWAMSGESGEADR